MKGLCMRMHDFESQDMRETHTWVVSPSCPELTGKQCIRNGQRMFLDSSAACNGVISIAPAAFPQYCMCAYSTPNTEQHSTSVRETAIRTCMSCCCIEIKYRLPTGDIDQDAAT